ncbi:MAG TPA: low-specificity L-threonine aldolase [Tepidisphaeraceae bacterium]|jgi:threonine aldolase
MIDLRSDTVTRPTPAMRKAMAEAEVGDDVFGEDPTVIALEQETAELLGKEAALFVPSGTMGNELAVRLHASSGDEILLEAGAHIFNHEAGGAAALSGVTCRLIHGHRGIFTAAHVLAQLRPEDVHFSPVKVVCVENTNNAGSGSVWPIGTLSELSNAARSRGIAMHMDGARLWNAAVASGISEKQFASHCDSLSVCFSKGLGAPVGSALVGPRAFIERGRRFRKMWGGGMRQAGILAAGALYALRNHRHRMSEDHANAKKLAEGLASIKGVELQGEPLQTNIVRFRIKDKEAGPIVAKLKERGVLVFGTGPDSIRAVTHLEITSSDIRTVLLQFASVIH